MSKQVLLIGGASSGKTHFGAQLLSRLALKTGALRLRESPINVSLFETTLQRLGQGLSSDHTASGVYGEVVLPIQDKSGETMDIVWPDYAGEQIEGITQLRSLTSHWSGRIMASNHWIFMIRPMLAVTEEDLLNRPLHDDVSANQSQQGTSQTSVSKQSQFVELLQILRHIKGTSSLKQSAEPRLLVLLSCWDELGVSNGKPADLLSDRLPLLNAYVRANWSPDVLMTYGLSSLGKSLSHETVDAEYQDRGPESFGYVITPTGAQERDLTVPIADLVGWPRCNSV